MSTLYTKEIRKLDCHICCKYIFSTCIFFSLSSEKGFNFHLITPISCFIYLLQSLKDLLSKIINISLMSIFILFGV